jgi:hypothetical protein
MPCEASALPPSNLGGGSGDIVNVYQMYIKYSLVTGSGYLSALLLRDTNPLHLLEGLAYAVKLQRHGP